MQRTSSHPDFWRHCALLGLLVVADCTPSAPRRDSWISAVLPGPGEIVDPDTAPPVTPPRNGFEISRKPVGAFVLTEERAPEPRIQFIHVRQPTHWISLSFDTSDRRVNLTLTDDGGRLSAIAQAPGCHLAVHGLQYAPRGGYAPRSDERRLFAAMDTGLAVLGRLCEGSREAVDQYRRRFERSSTDFHAAIRVVKARAAAVFGRRTQRCLPPEPLHYGNGYWC